MTLDDKIKALPGPVLVLGAGGFIGANLLRTLLAVRDDVYGTVTDESPWRLQGVDNLIHLNGHKDIDGVALAEYSQWQTVFNCIAYGGYSWQTDTDRIYATNFDLTRRIVDDLAKSDVAAYVHAGSSSEYGTNCSGPTEDAPCSPNSHYAVSKLAATEYLRYMGTQGFPCAVLRLASVYGPLEDSERLIPQVVEHGLRGTFPPFVDASITRDFVYVDDVVSAFVDAALSVSGRQEWQTKPSPYGEIYNIGTGVSTSIASVAAFARKEFGLTGEPTFAMPPRDWDTGRSWYVNVDKAMGIGWGFRTIFEDGLAKTAEWAKARQ